MQKKKSELQVYITQFQEKNVRIVRKKFSNVQKKKNLNCEKKSQNCEFILQFREKSELWEKKVRIEQKERKKKKWIARKKSELRVYMTIPREISELREKKVSYLFKFIQWQKTGFHILYIWCGL